MGAIVAIGHGSLVGVTERAAGGVVLGKWLDGSEGGLWGLAIGFVLGFALAALSGWLLMRMKEE